MSKLWQVVVYEYTRHVLRRRFLFALFSVPAMIGIMIGVLALLTILETDRRPVGYIDHSGLLTFPEKAHKFLAARAQPAVPILAFRQEAQAEQALKAGRIQAYYVIAADDRDNLEATLVALDAPDPSATSLFEDFVRLHLLDGQPEPVVNRLIEGSNVTVKALDSSRETSRANWLNVLLPFFAGFILISAMYSTSGYLMHAVVEEKENRTIEVLIISLSPGQLMSGKVFGLMGVGLTQMTAWIGIAAIAWSVGRVYFPLLQNLRLEPGVLLTLAAVLAPAFVMIAALMVAAATMMPDLRTAQQVASLFTLPLFLPFWLMYPLFDQPNGLLATGLSFFPFTAPVALILRMTVTVIPGWQILLNILVQALAAGTALWLAGRAFRLGMLRYGKRVRLVEIFRRPG